MRKILSLLTVLLFVFVIVACGSKSFTVTFDTNGGSDVTAIEVNEGETFDAPTAPTKSGFDFDGWYKESALTNIWIFETDVVESDVTLYAKWSAAALTDQEKVDAAHTALTLPDLTNLTNASPRLILPSSGANSVGITWVINKLEYIAANGVITQPTFEDGDQTVTLTATLTSGTVSRTKVFTATVKALPSLEETEPLINETFDYTLGNILEQTTPWGPVSGKSGNSVFTIVDTITDMSIPKGSNALKIEAFLELQVEAPIVHAYDLVVFEVDLMQTTSSNGSAINIQSSSSSPVVAFGLDGASLFYRTDNGSLIKTTINVNQWYTLRAEVNLTNKTLEAFYYEDGQLVSLTPGPVTFTGTTALQSLFIRSGSSSTTELRDPAYVTNIVANRIEALPRPVEEIKLGHVEGIRPTVSVEEDATFTPDTPTIHSYYGSQRALVLTTEYTLAIDNPVDTSIPGAYTVTYTFTNVSDNTDIKAITQEVTVYSVGEPNEITAATATPTLYPDRLSDIEVTVVQPSGDLYYLLSDNATETASAILAGTSVEITEATHSIMDLNVGENAFIHFIVLLNGESNVFTLPLVHQEVEEISTAQQFYDAVQTNSSSKYFLLTADIDMTGFVWTDPSYANKLTSTFDGDGFTVSNLTLTKTAKGGIFGDVDGGTIKDIVFDNVHLTASAGVSAMLVGESRGTSVIENVVIMNSSSVGNADYASLIVSRVRNGALSISNLSIIDSNVEGKKDYAGGLVAGMDTGSSIVLEDIYLNNFELLEATEDTGQMAGIIIGRIQGNVEMKRIVAIDIFVRGIKNIGGLIGKSDEPGTTVTLTDIYLEGAVERLAVDNNNYGSIAANVADQMPTLSNVWVSGFAEVGSLSLDVAPEFKVAFAMIQNQAWWNTNIPNILASDLWVFADSGTPVLVDAVENMLPYFTVTLDYNFEFANEVLQVRQGNTFTYTAPAQLGYEFVGWFTDDSLTTVLAEGYTVTTDVTLYGKYEELAKYTVTFDVDGGSAVTGLVDIFDGSTITSPADPTKDGFTFEGWYKEAEFTTLWDFNSDVVTANTTLYARWEEIPAVTYTVSFEENDGTLVDDLLLVAEGATITAPTAPTKDGFTFNGWYKEVELTNLWVFETDTVTANITLYAGWEEILPVEITTAQAFYDMTLSGSDGIFLLANDIDFTGFTWTPMATTPPAFQGTLDGNGFIVSNIDIQIPAPVTDQFGGIFSRVDGAVIRNLMIHNITVNTTQRAGSLIGRVMSDGVLIENIVVKNANIQAGDANGTGGLIALVSANSEIYNVAVVDSSINSGAVKNAGGLVGRVDGGTLFADDIYIDNVTITSSSTADSDVGIGAIVGYVRNSETSMFSGVRLVATNVTLVGKSAGALAGYVYYPGTIDVMDAYLDVTFSGGFRTGLIGYWRNQVETLDQSSIFVTMAGNVTHSQTLQPTNEVTAPADLAWWNTNLSTFVLSDLWTVNVDGTIELTLLTSGVVEPVTHTVTFDSNEGSAVADAIVEEGNLLTAPAIPTKDGFTFDGWYKETELTNLWVFESDTVTADITLYAKWETAVVPPAGTAISNAQDFHDMTKSGSSAEFYLANDIDFTGFTWTVSGSGTSFGGVLNGNGKTISNITIAGDGTGVYAGIFQRTNGALIHDLTIDNADVNAVGRVGVLIGRIETSTTTINNVVIKNSSASGTAGEGVGVVVGQASLSLTITNLQVINSTALNTNKNVAFIAGRSDHATTLTDVYIFGSKAESLNLSTDAGVGGVVGYTNAASSAITMTRVVIEDSILKGRSAGFLVGYFRYGSLTATDVLADVEFEHADSDGQHGVIGRRNVDANTTDPVLTSVFAHYITQQAGAAIQLEPAYVLADLTGLDQAWWSTNLSGIHGSGDWQFDAVSKFYELVS